MERLLIYLCKNQDLHKKLIRCFDEHIGDFILNGLYINRIQLKYKYEYNECMDKSEAYIELPMLGYFLNIISSFKKINIQFIFKYLTKKKRINICYMPAMTIDSTYIYSHILYIK